MKRLMLALCLAFTTQGLFAQDYYLDVGLGAGAVPGGDDRQGKIMLNAAAYHVFSNQFHLGLNLSTGGNFIPGDNSVFIDANTEVLDPARTQWSSAMLKGRFFPTRVFPVYAGLGIGINSYWRHVNTVEADRTSQMNFAMAPELGIVIKRKLDLGLRYHIGGSTGDFLGNRPAEYGGNEVRLSGERVNILLLTFSYRIGL